MADRWVLGSHRLPVALVLLLAVLAAAVLCPCPSDDDRDDCACGSLCCDAGAAPGALPSAVPGDLLVGAVLPHDPQVTRPDFVPPLLRPPCA